MKRLPGSEDDLLLLTAREGISRQMLRAVGERMGECRDAQRFHRQCQLQKVGPLVLRALAVAARQAKSPFLDEAQGLLHTDCRRWFRHRNRVTATIEFIRHELNGVDVRFAFMRGVPFAERFYAHPKFRVCGDVDLLVPEQDRHVVESALMAAGCRRHPCKALDKARVEYVGQSELRHPDLRMLIDVNFRLTGNGAIGSVSQDMETVWARAVQVGGNEWRLSDEDTLLNQIRHVGHGHDFDTGLIQACADVAAILRTCGSTLDGDYVLEQARQCECLRIVRFFAHFFDTYYRDESTPSLLECLPGLESCASERECRLFAKAVLVPLVRRKHWRKAAFGIVYGNFRVAAKFWALDRFRRLLRMMAWAPWPTKHQLVMLTLEYHTESYWRRRIRFYFNPFLFIQPGLFVGITARLAVEASRAIRKGAALLTRWLSPGTKRPSTEEADVFATSGTGFKPVLLPEVNLPQTKSAARGNGENPCGPES